MKPSVWACLAVFGVLLGWVQPAAGRDAVVGPENAEGVFRYVSGKPSGSGCGHVKFDLLTMLPAAGGAPQQFRAHKGLMEKLTPGALLAVKVQKTRAGYWIVSQEPYEMKPGEDQPGVFVYEGLVEEESGGKPRTGIRLSKFGAETVAWIPNFRDENRQLAPLPEVLAVVEPLTPGDPVKAQVSGSGQNRTIKAIEVYVPPIDGEFVETVTETVDGDEFLGVTVKTDGRETVTALVPAFRNAAGKMVSHPATAAAVGRLKGGQAVTLSVRREGERTWLDEIRLRAEPKRGLDLTAAEP